MRFKHLTLQGYKSFANKVEFLFPTGVTAIVGPNGSGKSNVADGIRWVLGEQSIQSLRGKSSADMIFAGSRRRSRAGMAEVSMTLDNSDGWLPIDFSEVTLTRRAYRSGDNEYLINGSRVRLRDIAELLAEGGLSQRATAVIGQGLVDAALALRPQERRALFEEAAGIGLYRARREEALKRLEETRHNLERVYDIIGEITPRLQRLAREVEKVEECRRLTSHLQRLQRTWYGYHWGLQQAKLDRAVEKAAVLEAALEKQQRKASSLAEHLAQQRNLESDLRAQLRDWHHESANLLDEVGQARQALAVAEERMRLLEARREELLAELAPLESQQETQAERVARLHAGIGELEHELDQHRAQLADKERAWSSAGQQAREPTQRQAEAEQALCLRRTQLAELEQAVSQVRAEAARLAGEGEALRRIRQAWTSYDAGVQALLQSDVDGVIGPLAALIQVAPEWERAVEAALGPDLQAVVVKEAAVAEKARQVLQSAGARLLLLPLDSLRPIPPLPQGSVSAAGVVTCDPQVQPAVETLLGPIALCQDLASAYTLLPAMPPGSRCTTPAGIVLRADGALSVGETTAEGVLAGERALRENPGQVEEIERRCQEMEERRRAEAETIAALELQVEQLAREAAAAREEAARAGQEQMGKARTRIAVAEETLRSQQAAWRRETALLDRLQAQTAARRQRAEELASELAAVLARSNELHAEVSRMEVQLAQVRERIRPSEEELERLGDEQTALEEQERQARESMHDAETRLGRARLEVDRCQDELGLLSQRIDEDLGLVELDLADSVTAQSPLPLKPLVSELPIVEEMPEGIEDEIQRLKARLRRLGGVNPNAPAEYQEISERHQFLTAQSSDLEAASQQLHDVIAELDELMKTAFCTTFEAVASRFSETFTILFNGGAARLELTEPDDLMNTGVDITAQPPGKRAQRLALLSGGERSLTAVALLFALLQVSPAPFCVLDEVDAMLDEANVGRFRTLLEKMAHQTQFVIITHNRGTVEAADTIYGISMGADGVSQMISLKME